MNPELLLWLINTEAIIRAILILRLHRLRLIFALAVVTQMHSVDFEHALAHPDFDVYPRRAVESHTAPFSAVGVVKLWTFVVGPLVLSFWQK